MTAKARAILTLSLAALSANPALTQTTVLELDPAEGWTERPAGPASVDRIILDIARKHIANDKPDKAKRILSDWIERNRDTGNPLEPEALRLRGDAKLLDGNEFAALFDYERLIRQFPESSEYVTAIEREIDIAEAYLGGLKKRLFGLPIRIESSRGTGEELLVRAQERMPGSRLAERAAITLADYYYKTRDLDLAAEMYEVFLTNFPNSRYRKRAMRNRIYANIASFKGPEYDGLALLESRLQIQQFAREFPADAERAYLNEALIARIDESTAAQQLVAAEWYLKNEDEPAAAYTLRRLLRDQPGTVAAAQALQILDERGWLLSSDRNQGRPGGDR